MYKVTTLRSGRKGFGSSNFPRDLPFVQTEILFVTAYFEFRVYRSNFLWGNSRGNFKFRYLIFYTSTKYKGGITAYLYVSY